MFKNEQERKYGETNIMWQNVKQAEERANKRGFHIDLKFNTSSVTSEVTSQSSKLLSRDPQFFNLKKKKEKNEEEKSKRNDLRRTHDHLIFSIYIFNYQSSSINYFFVEIIIIFLFLFLFLSRPFSPSLFVKKLFCSLTFFKFYFRFDSSFNFVTHSHF